MEEKGGDSTALGCGCVATAFVAIALVVSAISYAKSFGEAALWIIVVLIATATAGTKLLAKFGAEQKGVRSAYHEKCVYCGKRLKYKSGQALLDGERERRCRACGADQPLG